MCANAESTHGTRLSGGEESSDEHPAPVGEPCGVGGGSGGNPLRVVGGESGGSGGNPRVRWVGKVGVRGETPEGGGWGKWGFRGEPPRVVGGESGCWHEKAGGCWW